MPAPFPLQHPVLPTVAHLHHCLERTPCRRGDAEHKPEQVEQRLSARRNGDSPDHRDERQIRQKWLANALNVIGGVPFDSEE